VTATRTPPAELEGYLDDLLERLRGVADVHAAYLVGSGALGAFDPEASDVDVVVVTAAPLTDQRKRALVAAAESVPVPARKLELVVYPLGSQRWQVNLNTGEHVSFDPAEEPPFWFVLDRAAGEQGALPLAGPPWQEVFSPVRREDVLDALVEALDWQEANEPSSRSSVLNACRAWAWLDTGRWRSKPDAADWLRGRVRAAIEGAR
jgi:hypothetical protein